ncbi:TPA: rhodanese-like domain-containing protein [Stenotrophomonas maltophilia]|uniref:Rhodanese-like domain-containing protein n=1 Tax=Stenotrophomonas maltophilia TaxID=40324 RepID=A0AAI9FY03_STEMA|nr:rhodanese-like domain-containing protein [Stenotrophomonas maltophilia]EKT4440012.1 rhodanese-like domain-containing protein [Stenotrophomonas maltophilia]MBN5013900.1 rhodanese-like domain-containing protein [Stenotrophomonas maltophilia]HDS1082925.1 rhodanese-like domain-containing protein [Stenotrophomonas maltophilia]HDS1304470.1 rhodanese-like domain-containing protein [Stenotrophomonas maltophilia]HDS1823094.1 rhodanese-like domain-containing protein [Stenotrophomonas maltophilia]
MNYEELLAFAGRNPMLSAALVGLTVAIIVTEIRRLFRGFKGIKPAELTQLINAGGTVVVDLSASGDFEKGHIAGSRNAQASAFGPDNKLVATAKQSPVVLVCRSGNASETAAKALKKAGFEKVYVLDGGIPAWQQAELPLVKGRN